MQPPGSTALPAPTLVKPPPPTVDDEPSAAARRWERSGSHSSLGSDGSSIVDEGPPAIKRGPSHLDARETRRSKIMMRSLAFFYHLSLSLLFTVWTELLLDDFNGDYGKASDFLGVCNGLERGIQFLSAPLLGNVSDCLGRQPVMIASLLLHLLALLIVILKPTANTVLAYFVINGISNCTLGMLNAIVADFAVGREKEGALTQQYGRLGMSIGLAMIAGPLTGPQLQKLKVTYPLYASMACLLISVALGYAMAESLPPQEKNKINLESSNPFWALKKAAKYRGFVLMALPFFLTQMSECVYSFMVLYTKRRLQWDYAQFGMFVASICVVIALVQGNLRYIVPRFISEKGCVLWGTFFHGTSMAVMGGAFNSWMMLAFYPPRLGAAVKIPGLMGLMANSVAMSDQGVLQGSIMSLRVLAKALGSPLFGKIFKHVFNPSLIQRHGTWVTGITFFVAGGMDLLALLVAAVVFLLFPAAFTPGQAATATTAATDEQEEVAKGNGDVELGAVAANTSDGLVGSRHKEHVNTKEEDDVAAAHGRVEREMVQFEGKMDESKDIVS